MQEHYPYLQKYTSCRVVFLYSFTFALFLYFSSPSLLEVKFCRNFLPPSYYSFWRVSKPTSNWRQTSLKLETNAFWAGDEMHFGMEKNVLVLDLNALKMGARTSATCISYHFISFHSNFTTPQGMKVSK